MIDGEVASAAAGSGMGYSDMSSSDATEYDQPSRSRSRSPFGASKTKPAAADGVNEKVTSVGNILRNGSPALDGRNASAAAGSQPNRSQHQYQQSRDRDQEQPPPFLRDPPVPEMLMRRTSPPIMSATLPCPTATPPPLLHPAAGHLSKPPSSETLASETSSVASSATSTDALLPPSLRSGSDFAGSTSNSAIDLLPRPGSVTAGRPRFRTGGTMAALSAGWPAGAASSSSSSSIRSRSAGGAASKEPEPPSPPWRDRGRAAGRVFHFVSWRLDALREYWIQRKAQESLPGMAMGMGMGMSMVGIGVVGGLGGGGAGGGGGGLEAKLPKKLVEKD
ncbi:hypothetical protein DFJ73DRAFT_785473 [Zopfochytrium polystomum]|nr:hypothetical protein DFJ73DRAFT_785473 [Zopfochytrium polystomum]